MEGDSKARASETNTFAHNHDVYEARKTGTVGQVAPRIVITVSQEGRFRLLCKGNYGGRGSVLMSIMLTTPVYFALLRNGADNPCRNMAAVLEFLASLPPQFSHSIRL